MIEEITKTAVMERLKIERVLNELNRYRLHSMDLLGMPAGFLYSTDPERARKKGMVIIL